MSKDKTSAMKVVAVGTTISSSLAGLVVGGYFLGRFIGNRLNWHPWPEIICILLGLGLGLAYVINTLIELGKRT